MNNTDRTTARKRALVALLVSLLAGCSDESLRVALEAQQRADEIQQTVFENQHHGLRVLLFNNLVGQLGSDEQPLSEQQIALLNDAWNQRDLLEFWALQNERAKALRLIGVDARLYGQQSIVDLLLKQASRKMQAAEDAAAAAAAQEVFDEQ